jgi:predicted DNA-binding protein
MSQTKRISIVLTQELYDALREQSKRTNVPHSAIIREAIAVYLAGKGMRVYDVQLTPGPKPDGK